jgi:hypothetical protein
VQAAVAGEPLHQRQDGHLVHLTKVTQESHIDLRGRPALLRARRMDERPLHNAD